MSTHLLVVTDSVFQTGRKRMFSTQTAEGRVCLVFHPRTKIDATGTIDKGENVGNRSTSARHVYLVARLHSLLR